MPEEPGSGGSGLSWRRWLSCAPKINSSYCLSLQDKYASWSLSDESLQHTRAKHYQQTPLSPHHLLAYLGSKIFPRRHSMLGVKLKAAMTLDPVLTVPSFIFSLLQPRAKVDLSNHGLGPYLLSGLVQGSSPPGQLQTGSLP